MRPGRGRFASRKSPGDGIGFGGNKTLSDGSRHFVRLADLCPAPRGGVLWLSNSSSQRRTSGKHHSPIPGGEVGTAKPFRVRGLRRPHPRLCGWFDGRGSTTRWVVSIPNLKPHGRAAPRTPERDRLRSPPGITNTAADLPSREELTDVHESRDRTEHD